MMAFWTMPSPCSTSGRSDGHLIRTSQRLFGSKVMSRTQNEVDALWPVGMDTYLFEAEITVNANTKAEAEKELQRLYDSEGVAGEVEGEFVIKEELRKEGGMTVFKVEFARSVDKDFAEVNSRLRRGDDFQTVLA